MDTSSLKMLLVTDITRQLNVASERLLRSWAWWYISVIPALWSRVRSLRPPSFAVKSCLKNKTVWAMVAYAYNPSYLEG
jgi:hypothetical protein